MYRGPLKFIFNKLSKVYECVGVLACLFFCETCLPNLAAELCRVYMRVSSHAHARINHAPVQ